MLDFLVVQEHKPITQEVAVAATKRGAPIEDGEFFVWVGKSYDGIASVIDPLWTESDDVAVGARYNKIPTRVGERYGTTELTLGSLQDGDLLSVTDGKFVAAASGTANWKYRGSYAQYGTTMYKVEKVPAQTVA